MKQQVRLGLTTTLLLAFLFLLAPKTSEVILKAEKPTEMSVRHATWDEKKRNRATAKAYASAGWGWSGRQWLCLHDLWTRESRFDHTANNPKSSAYGIAQRIGETSRNPRVQILRGLRYIEHRFGTPCRALAFHNKYNHY